MRELSKAGALCRDNDTRKLRKSGVDPLARAIERHARSAGDHATAFPPLSLHRRDSPTEPISCVYGFGLAVTTQGGKQVMLGDKVLNYGPGQSMLTTIDSPTTAKITRATKQEPYLALLLRLDAGMVALLASEMNLPQIDIAHPDEPVPIQRLDPAILDALHRLIALLDNPLLLPRVAPLIQQEIMIRLLTGPHGTRLRQLSLGKPFNEQISKILAWMKHNATKTIPVADLAARANMSCTTFRHHFHQITGMSPLQYQKQLRLQEARQLMLNQNVDVSRAAFLVGYESASQFSREYRRQFGAPPLQDVRHMRTS